MICVSCLLQVLFERLTLEKWSKTRWPFSLCPDFRHGSLETDKRGRKLVAKHKVARTESYRRDNTDVGVSNVPRLSFQVILLNVG